MSAPARALALALLSACATAPAPAPSTVTVAGPPLISTPTRPEPRAGFFPLPAALAVDPRALPISALQLDVKRPEKLVLDNGLTLYLATDRTAPLVTVRALVLAGNYDDDAATLGTADLTFDLLAAGGAGALGADAVDLLLEQSAVNAGGGAGDEYSQLYLNARSQDLGRFFPLFADMLRKPRFEKARFEVELASRLESIRRRPDRADGLAARALSKAVFGPTSLAGREGTEATYKAVTVEGLRAFHARWVTPRNTVLLVSGDFSREALLSLVKANLGAWAGGARNVRAESAPPKLARRVLLVPKQVAQAKVRIGGLGYPRRSPQEYPMRLANTALGTFGIGRLYKEIRDEKGLAYSAYSSVSPGAPTGSFTVGFDTRPELVAQALEAALGILQAVKSGAAPLTAAELATGSDIALNTFAFRFDGAAKLTQEKAVFDLFGYPDDYLDQYRARVLAVDLPLANAAAAQLAALDSFQIVVVGPPEKLGDLAKFGPLTVINDVEAFR